MQSSLPAPGESRRLTPTVAALFVPLFLVMTGCSGSSGELGKERFLYRCAADSDPYCDAELYDSNCYGSCVRPFDGHLDEKVPGTVALGSSFLVLVDQKGLDPITPMSASASIVDWEGNAFRAISLGEVALIALKKGVVKDFIYLQVVAPTRLRVDHIDEQGTQQSNVGSITVPRGHRGWLRALSTDIEGKTLFGALVCAWSTGDGTEIRFTTDQTDNLVRFTADATETVTVPVHVSLGDLDVTVAVTVLDASSLGGGAQ